MSLPFPDIDPVAFHIGPLPVRWYALAYMAGFLLGWKYVVYLAGLDRDRPDIRKLSVTDIDDFLPWGIAGVILGGRIGYILFYNFHMYLSDPTEMFKIWEGGMSFHGGALGAIAAMILFSWKRRTPLLRLTDFVCCAVPIGLFFGRIANFINGELFGRVSTVPWAIQFPYGGEMPRHPSQLYESALEGLALFAILSVLAHREKLRNRAGFLSGVFLAGYGAARSFVEFFREPDLQIGYIAGIFTMGQILCVPMILAGIGLMVWSLRRDDEKPDARPA
jgi:phosphatidylglycerol:prolipoprotein diacylglycerol transferase